MQGSCLRSDRLDLFNCCTPAAACTHACNAQCSNHTIYEQYVEMVDKEMTNFVAEEGISQEVRLCVCGGTCECAWGRHAACATSLHKQLMTTWEGL